MISIPLAQKVNIRHASQEDLPALEWEGEFKHFRHIFAEAYRLMELGEVVMWVADLPENGIIGQLFVQLYGRNRKQTDLVSTAYIYGFRVRPVFRRNGIGSRLLETAEADLTKRGCRRISLNVARDNELARNFYERSGYNIVAPEPGIWSYLDHEGCRRYVNEPAWRMEKKL